MTSQFYSDSYAEAEYIKPIDWHTNQILLLDDNIRLSSMIARYVLLSCNEYGRSCALYHLGSATQPKLTYYSSGLSEDTNRRRTTQQDGVDFAVFVAATPRHAVTWLESIHPRGLTVVADVKLKGDIDIGLVSFIDEVADLEIPAYFVFVSDAPQNQNLIKPFIDQRKGSFVTKGGFDWTALPRRLVENAGRITYNLVDENDYRLLANYAPLGNVATPVLPGQLAG